MKWEVKGVDRKTGADRTIFITADDDAQAHARAKHYGVMVESLLIVDADIPTLDYSKLPPEPETSDAARKSSWPNAHSLDGGFDGFVAGMLFLLGCLIFAGGVLSFFAHEHFSSDNAIGEAADDLQNIASAIALLVGLAFWVLAMLIRLNKKARVIYMRLHANAEREKK